MKKIPTELELEYAKTAHSNHVEKLQKFVYYLMALATSAIGFAVYGTREKNFEGTDFILFVAVVCWLLSVFAGLRIVKLLIDDDAVNVSLLHNETSLQDALYLKGLMKPLFRFYYKIMWVAFFIGIILYFIWHIVQMVYNSPAVKG